jgi:hypothetical protein
MVGQFIYYAISILFALGYLALIELGFEHQTALILIGVLVLALIVVVYVNWIRNSAKNNNGDNKDKKLSKRETLKIKLENKNQDGI